MALFQNEDYGAALIEFEVAYEIQPHFMVRYNLAMCLYKLHRYGEAVTQIQLYLGEGEDKVPKEKKQEVEGILDELQSLVGSLDVSCIVEGAEVFVNGEYADKANAMFPLQLDVGEYEIEVRAEGYESATQSVKIPGGTAKKLYVVLLPIQRGDEVKVKTGGVGKKVPPAVFWSMAGVSAALAISAGVTGGMALKKEKDYKALGYDDGWLAEQNSGRKLVISADVLWGITGAAAAATIVLAIFTDFNKEETETGWWVTPSPLPGLALQGVF